MSQKLGIVTYNLARSWDLDTVIERCEAFGFGAAELRTTHTHGVEVDANVEETNQFVDLAVDIGAIGVKVRPNGLHVDSGIPMEQTLEQIGAALRRCGEHAEGTSVGIWLEVHGRPTQHPP